MELLARANELGDLGHDVIHLEVGEPDFPTPGPILRAAEKSLKDGQTRYTDARGMPSLREEISKHYAERFSVAVSPDRIFVTAGASGGLLLLTALLLNPGDNLLMADPGYPCNRHFLASFGAEGLLVPVGPEDHYQLTPAKIDQHWNDHSRGILVASPANPTGSILTLENYFLLAAKMASLGGLLLADEIYQGLVYENQLAATALAVSEEALVVNSFSKYFGMTGWRLGWVVVPSFLAKELEKLAQNLFICPSSIAQSAAHAAFSDEAITIMESQKSEFEARRNYLVPALRDLGLDVPLMPEGAFYVYARLPDSAPDSESFCRQLLEQQFVATTPGTDFGFNEPDRHVRISYAREIPQLKEAVERIGRLLS
jgi:aspartate/methionine/tyrosine aminotransferase